MWHPFQAISPTALSWLLPILLALCVFLVLRLEALGRRLKTDSAPLGIVSLEMSLSATESREIIESWDESAREEARRQLCVDFFFIPVYSSALATLGVMSAGWFAERGMMSLSQLALILAWGQWVAGLLDFAENATLLRILQMYPTIPERLPRLAGWCARIKFCLIILAVLCLLIGLVTSLT